MPRGIPNKPETIESSPTPERTDAHNAEPDRTKGRQKRVPMGVSQPKLKADPREGYVRRWFNDSPGRLQAAQEAGYEFVKDNQSRDQDSRRKERAGTREEGGVLHCYLMEIKEEFYREDQALKAVEIDKVDAAINRGSLTGAEGENPKDFYVPDQGSSITHG